MHPGDYSLWYLFWFFVLWLPVTLSFIVKSVQGQGPRPAYLVGTFPFIIPSITIIAFVYFHQIHNQLNELLLDKKLLNTHLIKKVNAMYQWTHNSFTTVSNKKTHLAVFETCVFRVYLRNHSN